MNAITQDNALAKAVPVAIQLTVPEIRQIAIRALEEQTFRVMNSIAEIEFANTKELEIRSVRGTVMEPIVDALRCRGLNVEYTYGSLREALGYHHLTMHIVFCSCENGTTMHCDDVAAALVAVEELHSNETFGRSLDLAARWRQ